MSVSYFDARSLKFISDHTNSLLEWLRLPGDALFIVGGTLPVLYLCWLGVRHMKNQPPREEPDGVLFTEIQENQKIRRRMIHGDPHRSAFWPAATRCCWSAWR